MIIPDMHKALLTLNTKELPIFKDALAPHFPGLDVQPLFLNPSVGVWAIKMIIRPGTTLPRHYHTGDVHLYTISGKWLYEEHPDQPQIAGSYLYEPGGSVHTFSTPADNKEDTEVFALVSGANINLDENNNYIGTMDATDIMYMLKALAEAHNMDPARYILASTPNYTTK